MAQRWKCNIEDWAIVDEEKIDFIMDESKLYLKQLFEALEKLDQKAFVFLGVLFTVISGLTGFFVSKYSFSSTQQNWKLLAPPIVMVAVCFVSCFFLIRCVLPKSLYSMGNETKNLLNREVCKASTRMMKVGEALDYQNRIDECKRQMRDKSKNMRVGLTIAFLSPLFGGITTLLL